MLHADPRRAVRHVMQRAIVFFVYWQDLAAGEIANQLGISARTVQRELADANRILKEQLG